jgi:hypothetical protein
MKIFRHLWLSRWIILIMRNVLNKSCRQTKYTFYSHHLFPESSVIYEIMSTNMVESERPQMTIWRRVVFWASKATRAQAHSRARAHTTTHTHTHALTHARALLHTVIYKSYCFSTATMVSWTRLNILLYARCLSPLYVFLCQLMINTWKSQIT